MTAPVSADIPDGDGTDPIDVPVVPAVFTPPKGMTAVFNQPNLGTPQAIQDYLCQLIDNTPSGETIRIAMYEFTQAKMLASIASAYARGVHIHYVGDYICNGTAANPYLNYQALATVLGTDTTQQSYAILCRYGCIGNNINHDKFYTFTKTGTAVNLCVQASNNLTNIANWNNAVVFNGYPKLYAAYVHRHGCMRVGATTGLHFKTPFTDMSDQNAKVYFYPEPSNKDTVLDQLRNITKPKGAKVHVAVYQITNTDICNKLASLKKAGAEVIVATTIVSNLNDKCMAILHKAGIPLHEFPYSSAGYLHSKYMTISGEYSKQANMTLVFTGSLNYTYTALHNNDESVVRISNKAVYQAFEADFANILTVHPAV